MELIREIVERIERYWAADVEIVGAWYDSETTGYLVYQRLIEPAVLLGRRLEFGEGAAGGTLESYVADVAVDLDEPLGAAAVEQDRYGIRWTAIAAGASVPQLPPDIAARLPTGHH
ncbi:hypothetical protein ACFOYW_06855 [Gryllotalpicola reticulitermitis]|uniref:DUF4440 domain-containing protein n=1 Tax=Gryllotalpicola reticulitermitis TaxID=1184153 RepID=A0ABV8Q6M1_9MICO